MTRYLLPLVALLTLCACQVGPRYARPGTVVPPDWRFSPAEASETVNTAWWRQFEDPVLDGLVDQALENNLDVRIAVSRVEEFAARVAVVQSGQLPQIGYGAGAAREMGSRASPLGIPPGVSRSNTSLVGSLNLAWELDVWGRIQSATDAARADYLASKEVRRTVVLTLVSAVATSYVALRTLDRQLEIAKETLKSRDETVKLFEIKSEGGAVSDLEVAQVYSEYHQAAVRIPSVERRIAILENAMSVLLGGNPGPIPRGLSMAQLQAPAVPAGLPSDLLLRRPDIRKAEYDLVAATADIRVARAQFFPTLSLTSFLGYASSALSDLVSASASMAGLGAEVLGPIFTGGRLEGQARVAEAVQRQSLAAYRLTIQTALQEVDDALVSVVKSRAEYGAQHKRVDALKDYLRLAQIRYDEGQVSYIEVLDASRRLFDAELLLALAHGEVYGSLVSVYKAMGGGWICDADRAAVRAECARRSAGRTGRSSAAPCPPVSTPHRVTRPVPCAPCAPRTPCVPCCPPPCDPCLRPQASSSSLPPPPTSKMPAPPAEEPLPPPPTPEATEATD